MNYNLDKAVCIYLSSSFSLAFAFVIMYRFSSWPNDIEPKIFRLKLYEPTVLVLMHFVNIPRAIMCLHSTLDEALILIES